MKRRLYFARGPNWVWHIDGYDKLKPYGFSLHGAIDGFSRRIMWLHTLRSNKNPKEVCCLYLNTIRSTGVPRKVVGDKGNKNVNIAASQRFFRRNENDSSAGYNSFRYGKSISNQRIEALWSQLRRSCTNWWINFFKDLITLGKYDNTSVVDVECALFSFYGILKSDVNKFVLNWNNHNIRRQLNSSNLDRPPDVQIFCILCQDMLICLYEIMNTMWIHWSIVW